MKCEQIVRRYLEWLGNSFETLRTEEDECVIATPYLDPNGDCIEITVRSNGSTGFVLSDNGQANELLFMYGIDLARTRSVRRQLILKRCLEDNQVYWTDSEITIKVEAEEELGPALHRLVSAITSLMGLAHHAVPFTPRTFKEKVGEYLRENRITFQSDIEIPGRIKNHRFDYLVEYQQTILIRTLSTVTGSYARTLAVEAMFSCIDIRKSEQFPQFLATAVVNDEDNIWGGEPLRILQEYLDKTIFWSRREELLRLII